MSLSQRVIAIKQIIDECNVQILLLTETKVCSKTAIKIEGFQIFPVVRSRGPGGGGAVVFLVAIKLNLCTTFITDSGSNAEVITVKLDFGSKQRCVILVYGPQEECSDEYIKEFYTQVEIQLGRACLSDDYIILAGTFNAKLGEDIIPRDSYSISSNGRRFLHILESFNLILMY